MILIHIFNGIRKESVQLSECANVAEVEYGAQLAAINQLLACYSAHSVAESVDSANCKARARAVLQRSERGWWRRVKAIDRAGGRSIHSNSHPKDG